MKMPQIILLIAPWILNRNIADAQAVHHIYTPIHILGANFSERFNTPFAGSVNPAMAPSAKGFAAATLVEKKYLTDLHSVLVSAAFGFENNGLNVSLQHFGNQIYSERTIAAGLAKRLDKISIGVAVKYTSLNITSLAATHFIQSSLGSAIKVAEGVNACVVLTNPNFFILKSTKELRPASGFSLGFGWQVSPLVYTGIEYVKREAQPMSVIVNIQYEFANDLAAMLNWTTAANQPYLSIAWAYRAFKLAAGCSYHASLGISPAVTMTYQKRRDEK